MKRDRHPGGFFLGFFHEIGVDAPDDGLMCDYQDVFAAFKFHYYGLEADYDVSIAGWGLVGVEREGIYFEKREGTYDSPPR